MSEVTSTGFVRTRLDERLAQLQADFIAIYGSDISIEPDDADGQLLGILAERLSDVDQLAEDVYNSFNPSTVTGTAQSRLVQLNGIRRIEGALSELVLSLTGQPNVTVPAGSIIRSSTTSSEWVTDADVTFSLAGTATVLAKCSVFGATTASIGTLTTIVTPIYGWFTVTNLTVATLGRSEESDSELRARQRVSTATPSQSILEGIAGSIAQIDLVRLVRVWENKTHAVDANGLPPHSIYAVVEGGVNADIAESIWLHGTLGATLVGSITTMVPDSIGNVHEIKHSRPTYSDIYITVNLSIRNGWPGNGVDQVKDKLVQWGISEQAIGEELIQSRLYDPVNAVPGHSISSIYIGLAPAPASEANIAIVFDGLARIDASRIVVNVA